jgi:hypothetical protein
MAVLAMTISRRPDSPPQFGAADRARPDVLHRHRRVSDERVDIFARLVEMHPAKQRSTEEQ